MRFVEALQTRRGEVVSLVGAGGKTTARGLLAQELSALRRKVVLTTTTSSQPAQWKSAPQLVVEMEPDKLLQGVAVGLRQSSWVLATRNGGNGSLVGLDERWVEALSFLPGVDNIIVKADGADGKLFKAPGPQEPTIPSCSNLVAPMVGVVIVGQPLAQDNVCRPDLVEELAAAEKSEKVTTQMVAPVIMHPQGGIKGCPPQARVIPMVNRVDIGAALIVARELAKKMLALGASRVVIARTAHYPSVLHVVTPLPKEDPPTLAYRTWDTELPPADVG